MPFTAQSGTDAWQCVGPITSVHHGGVAASRVLAFSSFLSLDSSALILFLKK